MFPGMGYGYGYGYGYRIDPTISRSVKASLLLGLCSEEYYNDVINTSYIAYFICSIQSKFYN